MNQEAGRKSLHREERIFLGKDGRWHLALKMVHKQNTTERRRDPSPACRCFPAGWLVGGKEPSNLPNPQHLHCRCFLSSSLYEDWSNISHMPWKTIFFSFWWVHSPSLDIRWAIIKYWKKHYSQMKIERYELNWPFGGVPISESDDLRPALVGLKDESLPDGEAAMKSSGNGKL